ncbi:MAG: hypothetical protein KME21_31800 [Desmonostoc vinosum HA7617-LM4]|jgi:hypothetical protein|nr:hypothetical protein [Desmonostoc vinosum HA7617-LM4]
MGITIHYTFDAGETSSSDVEQLINSLHSKCQDLPFVHVDQVVKLEGLECCYDSVDDPLYILKLRANKYKFPENLNLEKIIPSTIIGFDSLPRQGCEEFDIFLCRYPDEDKWTSESFCKTEFAFDEGGIENFIIAHCAIIEILDYAQTLGILSKVFDETGYWEKRDLKELISKVEQSRANIQAVKLALSQYNHEFINKLMSDL